MDDPSEENPWMKFPEFVSSKVVASQEQNTDDPDAVHENHCKGCIKLDCNYKRCFLTECNLVCGAKFHCCKESEHAILCPLKVVPCLNEINGCPVKIERHKMRSHIIMCPASVVRCTMEWNRWPVYSVERQHKLPFQLDRIHAKCGQLDVALALRDQRMLNNSLKVPSSTRRVLRNRMTQQYPAVPINSRRNLNPNRNESLSPVTDDDNAPWQRAKNPPGLAQSVCNQLFNATKNSLETPGSLDITPAHEERSPNGTNTNLTDINSTDFPAINTSNPDNPASGEQICDLQPGDMQKSRIEWDDSSFATKTSENSLCDQETQTCDTNSTSDLTSNSMKNPPEPPPLPLRDILGLDLTIEQMTKCSMKPKSMYTFLCAQDFKRYEFSSHFQNVHCEIQGGLNGWFEQRCPLAQYGCTFSIRRVHPHFKGASIFFDRLTDSFGIKYGCRDTIRKEGSSTNSALSTPRASDWSKESTPEIMTSQNYDSGVKVNGKQTQLCKIKEEQVNDKCDDDDEESPIPCNSLNVMDVKEFHKKASDELPKPVEEQLAINIDDNNHTVNKTTSFEDLPNEILKHIAGFLDSQSLCSLSVTSFLLRDICCSLLEQKGMVILEWERVIVDEKISWINSHKRWCFSAAFDAVDHWGFEDQAPMGQHMSTCPLNKVERRVAPIKVMPGEKDGSNQKCPDFLEKLIQAEGNRSIEHQNDMGFPLD